MIRHIKSINVSWVTYFLKNLWTSTLVGLVDGVLRMDVKRKCQLIFFLGLLQKLSCEKPPSAAIFTAWRGWYELPPRRALPTALYLTDNTFHRLQIQNIEHKLAQNATNCSNLEKLRVNFY